MPCRCPAQRWARCLPRKPKLCRIPQEDPGAGASVAEPRAGLSSTGAPCSQSRRTALLPGKLRQVAQSRHRAQQNPGRSGAAPSTVPCSFPLHCSAPRQPPHGAAPQNSAFPKTASPCTASRRCIDGHEVKQDMLHQPFPAPRSLLSPPPQHPAQPVASHPPPLHGASSGWQHCSWEHSKASRAVAPGSRRREAAHFQSHYGLKRVPSGIPPVQHIYFPKPQRGFVIPGSILARAARWRRPAGSLLPGQAGCCWEEARLASPGQRVGSPPLARPQPCLRSGASRRVCAHTCICNAGGL